MDGYKLLQEQLDSLAYGDVQPILLVTDVGYGEDMWVDVSLVDPASVSGQGYSSVPVFTRHFPRPAIGVDALAAEREMRATTIAAFGARLRNLLVE